MSVVLVKYFQEITKKEKGDSLTCEILDCYFCFSYPSLWSGPFIFTALENYDA
jgi:hypothetical protein